MPPPLEKNTNDIDILDGPSMPESEIDSVVIPWSPFDLGGHWWPPSYST